MSERFTPVQWAATANIYEVNVRQYTPEGTFTAFSKHLPRLKNMGINTLWFMPITPISHAKRQGSLGSYYACSDYTAINPEFGTLEDFRQLVAHAHELGMKIVVDWVGNHTGWDHRWTTEHPEFYKVNEANEFYDSHGWVDVIDLDYENADVWTAMIDAMKFWVNECDIDGFRCDMAHLVRIDFWSEARLQLDKLKKLFWLAETEEPEYHQVFDASYTWAFLHKMEDICRGNASVDDLQRLMQYYADQFPETALRLYFITNHDENSHSGSEYERLNNAVRSYAILCATMFNSLPLVYSGQELPSKKRLAFFDKDSIDWNGQYMMEDFYKTVLQLRLSNSALWSGITANQFVVVETTNNEGIILAYVRKNDDDAVLVLLNLSHRSMIKFSLTDLVEVGLYRSIWSGLEMEIDEETTFELQAWEYLVYEKVST
jgi:alpha-amylase